MKLKSILSRVTGSRPALPGGRESVGSPSLVDHRRYIRSPIRCGVQIGVQGANGRDVTLECRGIDLNDTGARVLSPAAVAAGSVVTFRCKELQLMGHATVRYCIQRKSKYMVGLEFHGALMRTY